MLNILEKIKAAGFDVKVPAQSVANVSVHLIGGKHTCFKQLQCK